MTKSNFIVFKESEGRWSVINKVTDKVATIVRIEERVFSNKQKTLQSGYRRHDSCQHD